MMYLHFMLGRMWVGDWGGWVGWVYGGVGLRVEVGKRMGDG